MIFKPNTRLADELRHDHDHQAALRAVAETARAQAERLAQEAGAPWMRRRGAQATVVIDDTDGDITLVNTDHAGHLIEFGGANNPPHAPLRRGVQAAGLRLDEQPKT